MSPMIQKMASPRRPFDKSLGKEIYTSAWSECRRTTSSLLLIKAERWFHEITDKRIRGETFRDVPALKDTIKNYIDNHNQRTQVFAWIANVLRIYPGC